MGEQEQIPTDEEAEAEFKVAEEAFEEKAKQEAKQIETEEQKTSDPKDLPLTAKENQQILAALGFKRYEDTGIVKYNIRVMGEKIGVTFNETNPLGKIWAYKVPEGDEEKEFLKNGELKDHPLLQKYHAIQEGKEPMPEISVTGKILEKRGKAIKVEIEENGETKEIFFGQGAVKKDNDGYFLPAGFSKATKEHEAKMAVPRDIRLPDYLAQLEQAPAADTTKEKDAPKEKGEALSTKKTTMGEAIKPKEIEYTDMRAQVTEAELIQKYTNLLANVTEAIKAEDRIPEREKGYGIKFVYYSVKYAMENINGGDHEEQA